MNGLLTAPSAGVSMTELKDLGRERTAIEVPGSSSNEETHWKGLTDSQLQAQQALERMGMGRIARGSLSVADQSY